MFKYLILTLVFAFASAQQWREGTFDPSACGAANGLFPTFLLAADCNAFWFCNDGWRYPFVCPGNQYFDDTLWVCNRPEEVNCGGRRRV